MQGSEHIPADFSRRKVLVALAVMAASQCFPSWASANSSISKPVNVDELDEFIRLSEVVTGTTQLDRDTAQKILGYLYGEPWGREHLAQIRPKLLSADSPSDRVHLFDKSRFTEGENWFIGHLLTTWFTGIYYHQISHAVSYRYALMHSAIEDVRPVPGHCNGNFGFWSVPPQGIKP